MNLMHIFVASTAAFLILGSGAAKAGQTINDVGAIACVNDKWDVSLKRTQVDRLRGSMRKDPRRSHRTEVHGGLRRKKYMPDGSWKGNGTCTYTYKGGDK